MEISREVLHYTGYTEEVGGIVAVLRALEEAGQFQVIHGVSAGFSGRSRFRANWVGPRLEGEKITPVNFWRARTVARAVKDWLEADGNRIFHGHSRAGMLVGFWLDAWGERRAVVSAHCYGRQRWFYRWVSKRMAERFFWLSPAMRRYYGSQGSDWEQCVPGGVPRNFFTLDAPMPLPGRLRLGGLGARVRWKRWDLVPAALRALRDATVTFEQLGTEPDPEYAAELHASDAPGVTWKSAEPDSTRLLREIDILVCSSCNEPFSMAMQEALAAGVPVLAAASGGALDLIRPGVNGWLFPDGDASALAALLRDLVSTRAWEGVDRTRVRASAWSADQIAAQWARIYASLDCR